MTPMIAFTGVSLRPRRAGPGPAGSLPGSLAGSLAPAPAGAPLTVVPLTARTPRGLPVSQSLCAAIQLQSAKAMGAGAEYAKPKGLGQGLNWPAGGPGPGGPAGPEAGGTGSVAAGAAGGRVVWARGRRDPRGRR